MSGLRPKSTKASSAASPRRRQFEGPVEISERGAERLQRKSAGRPGAVVLEDPNYWRSRSQTRERPSADPDEAFLDYPERRA